MLKRRIYSIILLTAALIVLGSACGKKDRGTGRASGDTGNPTDIAAENELSTDSDKETVVSSVAEESLPLKPLSLSRGRLLNVDTSDDNRAISGVDITYYYLSETDGEKYPKLARAISDYNENYINALEDFAFTSSETARNMAKQEPDMFTNAEDVYQVQDIPFHYQAMTNVGKCDDRLVSFFVLGDIAWDYGENSRYTSTVNYDPKTGETVYIDSIITGPEALGESLKGVLENSFPEDSYYRSLTWNVDGYLEKLAGKWLYNDVKYFLDYSGLSLIAPAYSELCPGLSEELTLKMRFRDYPDLVRPEYLSGVEGFARVTNGSFYLDVDNDGEEELIVLEHQGHDDPHFWNNIGISFHQRVNDREYTFTETTFLDINAYDPVILYGMSPDNRPFLMISSRDYSDEADREIYMVSLGDYNPVLTGQILEYSFPETYDDPLGGYSLVELPGDLSCFRMAGYDYDIGYLGVGENLDIRYMRDPEKKAAIDEMMDKMPFFEGEPAADPDTANVCSYDFHWEWADSEGDVLMTADYTIPQLTERSMIATFINEDIEAYYKSRLEGLVYDSEYETDSLDFDWWKESYGQGGEIYPMYTSDYGYRVTYRDDKYLCILTEGYEYYGGAHGMPLEDALIYSMEDGHRLEAPELFDVAEEAEFKEIVVNGVMRYVTRDEDDMEYLWVDPAEPDCDAPLWDNAPEVIEQGATFRTANYYLTEEGTVFYYGPYALAAFAFGSQYATIPYSELPLK